MDIDMFKPLLGVGRSAPPDLLPAQTSDLAALKTLVAASPLIAFGGRPGMGRTTLLRALAHDCDGVMIESAKIAEFLTNNKIGYEIEAISQFVVDALRQYKLVIFDDFGEILSLSDSQSRKHLFINILRNSWYETAVSEGRRLILGGNITHGRPDYIFGDAPLEFTTSPLGYADYKVFLQRLLGAAVAEVDLSLFHRSAPMLDLYQLTFLARLVAGRENVSAHDLLEVLEAHVLQTNLRVEEVEELRFDQLPGTEAIAAKLESHVIQPFLNKELADRLGLKPCRGILLYGPPGTGKTSIGRALAHRMEGRFFLIDGSFVTEPPHAFFSAVAAIVEAAKAASPSVLFIDDADVLFQIEHIAGFSRYLLSLLDGLESETAGHVCVMMTAMDAHKVPEALLRSGRVELWLETKAPDAVRRQAMLQNWLGHAAGEFESIDFADVAARTEGFTPADLRSLAGEARLYLAADVAREMPLEAPRIYVDRAVDALVAQRAEMTARLADERQRGRAYA
jgi:transitional endoplasmic reticulum ATPase